MTDDEFHKLTCQGIFLVILISIQRASRWQFKNNESTGNYIIYSSWNDNELNDVSVN